MGVGCRIYQTVLRNNGEDPWFYAKNRQKKGSGLGYCRKFLRLPELMGNWRRSGVGTFQRAQAV